MISVTALEPVCRSSQSTLLCKCVPLAIPDRTYVTRLRRCSGRRTLKTDVEALQPPGGTRTAPDPTLRVTLSLYDAMRSGGEAWHDVARFILLVCALGSSLIAGSVVMARAQPQTKAPAQVTAPSAPLISPLAEYSLDSLSATRERPLLCPIVARRHLHLSRSYRARRRRLSPM